jgi:hypothetical protein
MARTTLYIIKWELGGYSRSFVKKSAAKSFLRRAHLRGEVIQASPTFFAKGEHNGHQ